MTDQQDYEFQHVNAGPVAEESRRSRAWLVALAIAILVAAASTTYIVFRKRPVVATAVAPPAAVRKAEPQRPLGGEPEPVRLPPLDESDALVRSLVRALSNHPVTAAWLATDGLIRRFTVAVVNIAEGTSPAKQLKPLAPSAGFLVVDRGGMLVLDPRSYTRYGPVADAVASVEPAGAAKLYATLKPRIEEAAGELGLKEGQFDRVLERALVAVLRTPLPAGPVQVVPNVEGIGYAFADARLESLSVGQKALIRMGPRNAHVVKTKLREIALSLGVSPSQLPGE